MHEQVFFGLTPNQVTAWASIVSLVLLALIVPVISYYAWYSRRLEDATIKQAEVANKLAENMEKALNILLEHQREQREIEVSRVAFQLETAIQTVDGWKDRLNPGSAEFPQLPQRPVQLRPVNFIDATRSADRIDPGVASYMQVGLHFITEAEIAMNILRASDPEYQSWIPVRDKAVNTLNLARLKLDEARTRLNGQRRIFASS
jgi:hypothetical protein